MFIVFYLRLRQIRPTRWELSGSWSFSKHCIEQKNSFWKFFPFFIKLAIQRSIYHPTTLNFLMIKIFSYKRQLTGSECSTFCIWQCKKLKSKSNFLSIRDSKVFHGGERNHLKRYILTCCKVAVNLKKWVDRLNPCSHLKNDNLVISISEFCTFRHRAKDV